MPARIRPGRVHGTAPVTPRGSARHLPVSGRAAPLRPGRVPGAGPQRETAGTPVPHTGKHAPGAPRPAPIPPPARGPGRCHRRPFHPAALFGPAAPPPPACRTTAGPRPGRQSRRPGAQRRHRRAAGPPARPPEYPSRAPITSAGRLQRRRPPGQAGGPARSGETPPRSALLPGRPRSGGAAGTPPRNGAAAQQRCTAEPAAAPPATGQAGWGVRTGGRSPRRGVPCRGTRTDRQGRPAAEGPRPGRRAALRTPQLRRCPCRSRRRTSAPRGLRAGQGGRAAGQVWTR